MMRELHDRLTTKPSNQLTAPHLRRLIWCFIAFVWSPLALLPAVAAVLPAVGQAVADPLNTPPLLMVLAVVISTLAGATALLIRIDRELTAAPDKPLPRPWIMCASHMAGAWLAGVLAFIVCRQADTGVWWTLGYVLLASFASAKFLEISVERILPSRLVHPSSERTTS